MRRTDSAIMVHRLLIAGLAADEICRALGVTPEYVEALRAKLGRTAVHHVDGNPRNYDIANLRLVETRENRRG